MISKKDLACRLTFVTGAALLLAVSLLASAPAAASGPFGMISGRVTDANTGEPLRVTVELFDAEGYGHSAISTDENGQYLIVLFTTRTLFAVAGGQSAYVPELFREMPCALECDPTAGEPVGVIAPLTATDIDFTLEVGGVLTGTVTETGTGLPINSAFIEVYDAAGNQRDVVFVDASGKYKVDGLAAESYFVVARDGAFGDELYDNLPCPQGACDPTAGIPVEVVLGETAAGIDFELNRLGSVSGTVTEAGTGDPIASGLVTVYGELGGVHGSGFLDVDGRYRVNGLLSGNYTALVSADNYQAELYDDLPCPFGNCDVTLGMPITVALNSTTEDIDFALQRFGAVSGTVIGSVGGQPITDLEVKAMNAAGGFAGSGITDDEGFYTIPSLTEGVYFVETGSFFIYLDEIWNDRPCPKGVCDPVAGDPVAVTFATTTPGIDFALERLGSISGVVTSEETGEPLPNVPLVSISETGSFFSEGFSDAEGRYRIDGVVTGNHFVRTNSFTDYLDELYDDISCWRGDCDLQSGAPIAVSLDSTTPNIDFSLGSLGSISGALTDAGTGEGLAGLVEIFDISGSSVGGQFIRSDGLFNVPGLAEGTYFAVASEQNYVNQLYRGLPCQPDCDPTTGTPIEVVSGEAALDIDFVMVPDSGATCFPSPTALCLNDDRFQVEVEWRDFFGQAGTGVGIELTDDTGTFWFFSPANVELVIKVLDGCFDPFNTFWVFAGGLTDVEVDVTVTDTLTGEVRTYGNTLGTAFTPIQDLAAFATCQAIRPTADSDAATAVASEMDRLLADLDGSTLSSSNLSSSILSSSNLSSSILAAALAPETAPGVAARRFALPATESPVGCLSDGESLCLAGGRFEVETLWATDEQSGDGRAVQLTGDTGYFWFFSPANVETVVKVLDACTLDPFNNFWVFAAGLTDVEVTLRVTDTQTGEVQEWVNPRGTPYQPIRETEAFMTCP